MRRKIEDISHGLHCIEKMLQRKSKNIEEAQEIQKVTCSLKWLWHSAFFLIPGGDPHPRRESLKSAKDEFFG